MRTINLYRPSSSEPLALGAWLRALLKRNPAVRGAGSLSGAIGWFLALRDAEGADFREIRAFACGFVGQVSPIGLLVQAMIARGDISQIASTRFAAGCERAWERAIEIERGVQQVMS